MSTWEVWKRRLKHFFGTRDGRPWMEVIRERALEASIPGRSNLHGSNFWVLPVLASSVMWGEKGFMVSACAFVVVFFLALPYFDESMLLKSLTARVDGERKMRAVINRMGKQLGLVYGLVMLPPVIILFVVHGRSWSTLGACTFVLLAGELATYVAGEFLWSRHVGVGTRLRIFDRNHAMIDDALDDELTVDQFRQVAQFKLGERYQRTWGWRMSESGKQRV